MSKRRSGGFTIVELLIVIVVIGILAAIVIVAYNGIQDSARAQTKVNDLKTIQKLILAYYAQNGSYPSTSGSYTYQRLSGDAFIPGINTGSTAVTNKALPSVTDGPTSSGYNNTYAYQSDGTTYYNIIRLYQPSVPTGEWSNIPTGLKVFGSYTDRWGYKS